MSELPAFNIVLPTDNKYDVPVLRLDKQATHLPGPVVAWGSRLGRATRMLGTYHFYVDDYRFSALWKHPDGILKTTCTAAMETNFSVYDQTSYSVALYQTFRKRWLSRYWQTSGLRILVDLNVGERYAGMNLLGVPRGWRAFCTRGYSDRLDGLERELDIAVEHAATDDILFVVVGGGDKVRAFCELHGAIHIPETRDLIREQQATLSLNGDAA